MKRMFSIIVSLSLLVGMLVIASDGVNTAEDTSNSLFSLKTVQNVDTGLDYATIQGAIDAAETLDGHTIIACAGTYYEHVVVNKALSLIGENKNTTIIDGNGTGVVLNVTADNVRISGFTAQNSGTELHKSAGIMLFGASSNNIISDNIVKNGIVGIAVGGHNNTVSGNIVTDHTGWGIASSSNNSTISGNVATNNIVGIHLIYCSNTTIRENTAINNTYSIYPYYSSNNSIYHNNIISNTWQIYNDESYNTWDNGYPSGGNHWSDYTGADLYSGPYQNETGNDGIGDTPYIDERYTPIRDNYPLMQPYDAILTRTYTLDSDFDEGTLIYIEHETEHDQLQLSENVTSLPFIWAPNTGEGTVSKVDTVTGREVGRYWVSNGTDSSPSRTTVDLLGNCWVGCRQRGTVVKIGLFEAGQWIDRNGDSVCQTSQDANSDGEISGGEILPWGQDECVLYEVVLVPSYEGTYIPGTYSGPYDYNYWGVSPRGLAVDASNNLWAGTWSTSRYFYINGTTCAILRSVYVAPHNAYGAVIDENGILWSAEGPGSADGGDRLLLRLDPSTDVKSFVDLGHTCYGLGLDYSHHLWVSSYWEYKFSRIDILVNPPTFVTYAAPEQVESRGVAATSDNNIWVANTGANTVTRYDNDGNLIATITGLNGPTGVSVDIDGMVWATDRYDEYLHRIDPASNTIDLSKQIVGSGGHYTYSDMTGIVLRTITTKIGTWAVVFDSMAEGTPWGTISWNSSEPVGTSITVKVRSSDDKIDWSEWEGAANGVRLGLTPNGRYMQIETAFHSARASPILYDLTVRARERIHDLAASNVVPSKAVVGLGYGLNVNVTAANQGDFIETFDVILYAQSLVTVNETGLVGYWKFDEGGGTTAYDSSGNGKRGSIHGAAWTDGKCGKALSLDGSDDYIVVGNSTALNPSPALTISAWVFAKSYSGVGEGQRTIVERRLYGSDDSYQLVLLPKGLGEGRVRFSVWSNNVESDLDSADVVPLDQWCHVAATYDGSSAKIYLNGTQNAAANISGNLDSTSLNTTIGAGCQGTTNFFNGTIDEVRIYSRSLSAEEIAVIAEADLVGTRVAIQKQTVTLESGASTTLNLAWNTSGFAMGDYIISVIADPVPGETDIADNMFVDGWVMVTIPGDVNGDKSVNIYDVVAICVAYGSKQGEPAYVSNCDVNGDGKIDIYDAVTACVNYGQTIP